MTTIERRDAAIEATAGAKEAMIIAVLTVSAPVKPSVTEPAGVVAALRSPIQLLETVVRVVVSVAPAVKPEPDVPPYTTAQQLSAIVVTDT